MAVDLIGFGIVLPDPAALRRGPRRSRRRSSAWSWLSFSLAQLLCAPVHGAAVGPLRAQAGAHRLAVRHRRRQPAHRPGRVGVAAVPRPARRRRVGGQRVGGPGGGGRRRRAGATGPACFGLLGAAFGVGFVLGPAIGTLRRARRPAHPVLHRRRDRRRSTPSSPLRRLPETHPPAPARRIGRPAASGLAGSFARAARRQRAAADRAWPSWRWSPSAASRRRSRCSSTTASASLDRVDRARCSRVIGIALVLVQAGLVHPASRPARRDRARCGSGSPCNAVGLLLLAADGGWRHARAGARCSSCSARAWSRRRCRRRSPARSRPSDRGQALGLQQSAGWLGAGRRARSSPALCSSTSGSRRRTSSAPRWSLVRSCSCPSWSRRREVRRPGGAPV